MKVVGFLQNAWSPLYAGGEWPRESWLRALWLCRTGSRLKLLEAACPGDYWWDNTTPIVGATPDSVVKPDLAHMRAVVRQQRPDIAIGFGRQACQMLCMHFEPSILPVLLLPHPAYRVVTNELWERAAVLLRNGWKRTVELRQERGRVVKL